MFFEVGKGGTAYLSTKDLVIPLLPNPLTKLRFIPSGLRMFTETCLELTDNMNKLPPKAHKEVLRKGTGVTPMSLHLIIGCCH